MHISRLATEILLDIFAAIYDDFRRDRLATLAALARTCKTFKEPALDILWRKIIGFTPIISCLPERVVGRTSKGTLSLKSPLRIEDWNAFAQYAHRIRSLTIQYHHLDKISDRVVRALVSRPSSVLLSNLRSLRWQDERECFLPLLRTLLVPTIRSMELGSVDAYPLARYFAKSDVLDSLGARCPSIRELICAYSGDSDAISELVCGWKELLRLETGVLNTRSLCHLASLPSLKSLRFRSPNDSDDTQPNSTAIFTSQLDDVRITAPVPQFFTRHLRNVRFLSCRSVVLLVGRCDLELSYYDPLMVVPQLRHESQEVQDLMVSLSQCFSPALEEISFDFSLLYEDGCPLSLDFDAVAPLLLFNRLTKLDLDWFSTLSINDSALENMAQSWPQLEELSLGTATGEWPVYPPYLTFLGLVHLIRHCRRLRYIAISFCAGPIDIVECEPFAKTIPNEKITHIGVGISPIVNPIVVACQLHALLPNLTYAQTDPDTSPLPHEFRQMKDNWKKVEEFLEVLVTGAQMRDRMNQTRAAFCRPKELRLE